MALVVHTTGSIEKGRSISRQLGNLSYVVFKCSFIYSCLRYQSWKNDAGEILGRLQKALVETSQTIAGLTAEYTDHNIQEGDRGFRDFRANEYSTYASQVPLEVGSQEHGLDVGLPSLYKGLPFFSLECQTWVRSRAGESVDVNTLFHCPGEDYDPRCLESSKSSGALRILSPRSELERCLETFYSAEISRVFPVVQVSTLPSMVDAIYNQTATADIFSCIYALITFITGFSEDASFSLGPEVCEAHVRVLIPDLLLQGPTMASLQTMLLMVKT
jgi:hypothetical protein